MPYRLELAALRPAPVAVSYMFVNVKAESKEGTYSKKVTALWFSDRLKLKHLPASLLLRERANTRPHKMLMFCE